MNSENKLVFKMSSSQEKLTSSNVSSTREWGDTTHLGSIMIEDDIVEVSTVVMLDKVLCTVRNL